MVDLESLVERAAALGRINTRTRALRWLRAVAGILADWGGDRARRALAEALPAEVLRGTGSGGATWEKARAGVGPMGETAAPIEEAARRARQPDPGKAALTFRALAGLIKEQLTPEQAEAVSAGLPAPAAALFEAASTEAPWGYRLPPQSYARPDRVGPHH